MLLEVQLSVSLAASARIFQDNDRVCLGKNWSWLQKEYERWTKHWAPSYKAIMKVRAIEKYENCEGIYLKSHAYMMQKDKREFTHLIHD